MNDTVKMIFKTLILVPCIIFVAFLVFNIFAFGISYFKILSLSQVALQAAIENNYITNNDRTTLENYMNDYVETDILENVAFTPNTTFTKLQYGEEVTVGITANYRFILPLTPLEETTNGFATTQKGQFSNWLSESTLQQKREDNISNNNINIEYKVPGLHYYADLN